MIAKVIAYITRERVGETQLLVFEHVDQPDAGVQVPKGTMEQGESPVDAARREVREETGLTQVDGLKHIGKIIQTEFGEPEEWNFFAMALDGDAPDSWVHFVGGKGEDKGMRFRFYWLTLPPYIKLAGNQGDGLWMLKS